MSTYRLSIDGIGVESLCNTFKESDIDDFLAAFSPWGLQSKLAH